MILSCHPNKCPSILGWHLSDSCFKSSLKVLSSLISTHKLMDVNQEPNKCWSFSGHIKHFCASGFHFGHPLSLECSLPSHQPSMHHWSTAVSIPYTTGPLPWQSSDYCHLQTFMPLTRGCFLIQQCSSHRGSISILFHLQAEVSREWESSLICCCFLHST